MTVAARMAALVARVPELAQSKTTLGEFWREVDAEMELIVPLVESDADQCLLDEQYQALIEKADAIGLLQPEAD